MRVAPAIVLTDVERAELTKLSRSRLVELKTQTTPAAATQWSTRLMAAEPGVAPSTVHGTFCGSRPRGNLQISFAIVASALRCRPGGPE